PFTQTKRREEEDSPSSVEEEDPPSSVEEEDPPSMQQRDEVLLEQDVNPIQDEGPVCSGCFTFSVIANSSKTFIHITPKLNYDIRE
ncbi:hypothetical protein Prudu_000849, partial [Prunus dulcis]